MGSEREARLALEREVRRRCAKAAEPEIIRKERSGEIQPDEGFRFRTCAANFQSIRCWRSSRLRELHGRFHESDSSRDQSEIDDRRQCRLGSEDLVIEECNDTENSATRSEENTETRMDNKNHAVNQRSVIVRLANGTRRIVGNPSSIHGDADGIGNCDNNDIVLKP